MLAQLSQPNSQNSINSDFCVCRTSDYFFIELVKLVTFDLCWVWMWTFRPLSCAASVNLLNG